MPARRGTRTHPSRNQQLPQLTHRASARVAAGATRASRERGAPPRPLRPTVARSGESACGARVRPWPARTPGTGRKSQRKTFAVHTPRRALARARPAGPGRYSAGTARNLRSRLGDYRSRRAPATRIVDTTRDRPCRPRRMHHVADRTRHQGAIDSRAPWRSQQSRYRLQLRAGLDGPRRRRPDDRRGAASPIGRGSPAESQNERRHDRSGPPR